MDAKTCPYCGKSVALHEGLIIPEPEKKKDKTVLIIVAVVILLVIVPIAIAASVYVYVSGMIGPPNISSAPLISFIKDENMDTLSVGSVYPSDIEWGDIYIQGNCDTSSLGTYVSPGNKITDCSGTILIVHKPTNTLLGTWAFT